MAAFWDNNDDKIGFIDENNIDRKKWGLLKGKMCNIHNVEIDENTTLILWNLKSLRLCMKMTYPCSPTHPVLLLTELRRYAADVPPYIA